jgi:hypothetical protein
MSNGAGKTGTRDETRDPAFAGKVPGKGAEARGFEPRMGGKPKPH